jgi:hypothetical protein
MNTDSEFGYRPTLPADLSDDPKRPKRGEARQLDFAVLRKQFKTEAEWLDFVKALKRQVEGK